MTMVFTSSKELFGLSNSEIASKHALPTSEHQQNVFIQHIKIKDSNTWD